MAFKDYNATADSNTTLAGLPLQEGQTQQKHLNNFIRQMMADLKAGAVARAPDAATVNGWDFTGVTGAIPNTVAVDQLGLFYYDSADSSTADDGETTLVTTSGQRYKRFAGEPTSSNDADAPVKFSDSDSSPSVSGRKTFRFADAPADITIFDNMSNGDDILIYPQTTNTRANIVHNGTTLICPQNQSHIYAQNDPPVRVIMQGGVQYVIPLGLPRRSENYGPETVTISSGTAAPTRTLFYLDGQGAAADNLVAMTVSGRFKPGEILTAIIRQLPGAAITVVRSTNLETPNGKNYTFSAKRTPHATVASTTTKYKHIYFRVNEAGTGVELLDRGFDIFESHNEPFSTQDAACIWFFGQSNAGPTTVSGTATTGALTYVRCQETGDLTWSAFDTSGSAPFATNCHITASAVYTNPFHSWAQLWEDNQATDSLPICYAGNGAQGGNTLSAKRASADTSRWNPEYQVSASGGTPAPSTDGYYPIRAEGDTDSGANWSLYELAQQMIRKGINEIEALDKRVRCLGVVWVHGESDSLEADTAAEYFENLVKLYGAICRSFGRKVPFFMAWPRSEVYTYVSTVQEAMLSFARMEPWAVIIDPFTFANYNASDTGQSPGSNFGIFAQDAGGDNGIHYAETTSDNFAQRLYDHTINAGFYGVYTSKAQRDATEHRRFHVAVRANGSGSNDDAGTFDEYLDNGQASAVSRIENFGDVRFASSSQTIVQHFDPTTGRVIVPYAGTYRLTASIRTTSDDTLATNATTGTEIRIYSNTTQGAGSTAGTLRRKHIHDLVDSGVTWNANGRFNTINTSVDAVLAAGEEVIFVNNNYRQSSSDFEWVGTVELLRLS